MPQVVAWVGGRGLCVHAPNANSGLDKRTAGRCSSRTLDRIAFDRIALDRIGNRLARQYFHVLRGQRSYASAHSTILGELHAEVEAGPDDRDREADDDGRRDNDKHRSDCSISHLILILQ